MDCHSDIQTDLLIISAQLLETESMAPGPTSNCFAEFSLADNFFLCRKCHAHLAPTRLFLERYKQNNKQYGLFKSLVNVELDPEYVISNTKTTVRCTYCIDCKEDLGFRFIELKEETHVVRKGTFLLYMNKLLLWKDKQLVDPEEEEELKFLHVTVTEEEKELCEDFYKALQNNV